MPGLGAKPIIDILLGAPTLAEIESHIPAVEALGYFYASAFEALIPERRYFYRPHQRPSEFHLHAVALDSDFFRDHLGFRDALRNDPVIREAYWRLKSELASKFADDREAYTEAKGPFIRSVIAST